MESHITESALFRPRDPSITSEDDWPEFQLANVEVKEKKGHHFSLLLASKTMPMTVIGNLILDKNQQQFCELPSAPSPSFQCFGLLLTLQTA